MEGGQDTVIIRATALKVFRMEINGSERGGGV